MSCVEKLPDQVLFATHASGHNGMGRDTGQVTIFIVIHWFPGIVLAKQLILSPVSLLWQVLWGRKAWMNGPQVQP